jgi:hypothetical protein
MKTTVSSDLLSATSLLVAVVALLYSVWQAEIKEILNRTPPMRRLDRDSLIAETRSIARGRSAPLAIAGIILMALLFPVSLNIVVGTMRSGAEGAYNPVLGCFLAAYAILAFLVVVTCSMTCSLLKRIRTLEADEIIR